MPVAVTLSSKLQEALGHDVADELVGYLNTVDTTSRADMKELIDQRFARFSAEMAQLRAEIRSEMASLRAELIKWMFLFWATTGLAVLGLYR